MQRSLCWDSCEQEMVRGQPQSKSKGEGALSTAFHSTDLLSPSGWDFGPASSQSCPALWKVLVINGVLACRPSAGTTELTSPPCLAWLFGTPWPPTEITTVPLSSATDKINSFRAKEVGQARSTHRAVGANCFGSSCSIWGTNETRGKTCQRMPNARLLMELIQPWPNWTAMQKCPSFFAQFCSSVLCFKRRRIKTLSVPRLPLSSTKIQGRRTLQPWIFLKIICLDPLLT